MSKELSYATFTIDGKLFGILIEDVQEILRPLEVTEVPLASMAFNGLINLRGNIVLAVRMRQQLGLPTMEAKFCMNIILKLRDEFYSLQVDSVADVV
ncbi:MAG: chemotaxis protein CheW, partial [Planctomycetota bacterium]